MDITDHCIKKQNEILVNGFKNMFASKGYLEVNEVKITSKIDSSVFFVGSTISVLKPYLLNGNIPEKGLFIVQRAIRTRMLKDLYNTSNTSEWSSYFKAMGILAEYGKLKDVVWDMRCFFVDILKIPVKYLMIRISSEDRDLMEVCRENCNNMQVEVDTMLPKYYRHKYGLSDVGIYGRNFNIAILDKSSATFKDVANIIVIEDDHKQYGIEFATGSSAILARLNGYNHTIKSSVIANTINIHSDNECKLADCFSVVVSLIYEGIKPNSSSIHGRILKKYLMGLFYYVDILKYSLLDIINIANQYFKDEYGICRDDIGTLIANYYGKW